MGGFANSVFQAMTGWLRTLVSLIWNYAADSGSPSLIQWIGNNWVSLIIGLCILGVAADFTVYLFRWKPYLVWKSFFHRNRARKGEKSEEGSGLNSENNMYQDAAEEHYRPERRDQEGMLLSEPEYSMERENSKPVRSWEWNESLNRNEPRDRMSESGFRGYRMTDDMDFEEDYESGDRTARFEQALKPQRRRRSRVSEFIGENAAEQDYVSPDKLIDRRDAYRRPVYPSNWRRSDDQNQSGK